ncbi:PaaI family thioesterase [Halalkalicoccus sp. NIPERK01]|uniref:PaaI family thioesterase n=1 Tax=Halalkalicoccus sp. NIPERK01 TaxID=3053469 RepID=UPI00256F5A9E|nr:PaaI family thioesterase [Halalkalicoccus sp. NIPERK01]MDL5361574.1 PaaI family thioesterase [Halalkalicoccus sp. NIPERK01]
MTSELDTDGLQSFITEHGYLSWLGVELDAVERGRVRMSVPGSEDLRNPGSGGSIHGGIAATLIDTASGFALRTTFEDPANARLATTDLDVSYLRPATGDLVVEAEVLRAGGRTGVTDVAVESDTETVAVGRITYRLFRES